MSGCQSQYCATQVLTCSQQACSQAGEIITGLQSVPVFKLPIMLAAPRKFSWENAFIDLSMADHDTAAAAAEEAQEAAEAAAAAAVAVPGKNHQAVKLGCCQSKMFTLCHFQG